MIRFLDDKMLKQEYLPRILGSIPPSPPDSMIPWHWKVVRRPPSRLVLPVEGDCPIASLCYLINPVLVGN